MRFLFIIGLLVFLLCSRLYSQYYSFAGYKWNQEHTPDRVEFLGNGEVVGGALFAIGLPSNVTRPVEFPSNWKGFRANLSLGSEDPARPGPRALNLPLYDDGTSMRHGVTLSWSGNRVLPNMKGEDFVVYESGEGEGSRADKIGPELYMVRVRNAVTSVWSPWYHKGTDRFQIYGKRGSAGAYAAGFDLDDFGVKFGGLIDRIQIANMTRSDRLIGKGVPFRGQVLFVSDDGEGRVPRPVASFLLSYESKLLYGPDLLYVASLHRTFQNPIKRADSEYQPPQLEYNSEVIGENRYSVQLLAVKGDVKIMANENSEFLSAQEVYANMRISAGYSIVTGNASAATLLLPGGAALILQPGSLLSLDSPPASGAKAPDKESQLKVHLIRGSFLLGNQSEEGRSLPVSVYVGESVLEGAGAGILFFQFGQPLQGFEVDEAGRIRKEFFDLKTSLYNPPEIPEVVVTPDPDPEPEPEPPGPEPPPPDPEPEPEPEPEPPPLPVFNPPDINPLDLPFSFSPNNLLLQSLGFLNNPVIPEGSESLFRDATGAPIDPNVFSGLLIPGYEGDSTSSALQRLAGNIDLDGVVLLGDEFQQSVSEDNELQIILSQIGDGAVQARLILDDNGNPFLWVGDQQLALTPSMQEALNDNPDLLEYLKVSGTEGLQVQKNADGSVDMLIGDNGQSLFTLPENVSNLHPSQTPDGDLTFVSNNPHSFTDITPPGIVGDGASNQRLIKFPEGREGQLRRARAQHISKVNALKQAQLRKHQVAQRQASTASRVSQQRAHQSHQYNVLKQKQQMAQKRAQQQAAYAAKQAQKRAQQKAHQAHQYNVLKQKQQRAQQLSQQQAAKK